MLGETMERDAGNMGGDLIIKGEGNNYRVNELEPQSLRWKGKGKIAVDKQKNFQKAELSKRPDVQD